MQIGARARQNIALEQRIANQRGAEFLTRDSGNVARWFAARGLTGVTPAPADLADLLLAEARLS